MYTEDPRQEASAAETESPSAGLYVHVPFCLTKCLYCDFYSVTDPSLCDGWLHALEHEAMLYRARFAFFDTLYLGGGTPSLLSEAELCRLVESLFRHFSFSRNAEVTLEANPEDLTPEKLTLYKRLGFNRISLGVQSMDDEELAYLGRRHNARSAARAMEMIGKSGFSRFSADLIYGPPGQTEAQWKKTLEKTLAFSPDHISCYQLTANKSTPLWKRWNSDGTLPLSEEDEASFFLTTSEMLEQNGFIHYEVSNYARGRPHICRHNMKYWERAPYLGLGPSAHSFHGNVRWWNHSSIKRYCRELEQGRRPVREMEHLSAEQVSLERLSLKLRTGNGIALNELNGFEKTDHVLPGLLEQGFLEVVDERAVPTRKGFLVADRLPLVFL